MSDISSSESEDGRDFDNQTHVRDYDSDVQNVNSPAAPESDEDNEDASEDADFEMESADGEADSDQELPDAPPVEDGDEEEEDDIVPTRRSRVTIKAKRSKIDAEDFELNPDLYGLRRSVCFSP